MAKVTDMNSAARVLGAAAPQYKTSDATKRAYAALKNAYSNRNSWSKRIRTNIKRLYAMGDFDPNKSAYYQNAYHSLKQAYQNTGKRDMLNAAATATANTGGLANSYAATAANQAYVFIAPAMNTNMYENPIVQENLEKLRGLGYQIIEPKEAMLACGTMGKGALADVEEIVRIVETVGGIKNL